MNNAVATPAQSINIHFNETQWLQALFLLADTQSWLQQLQEGLIWQLPVKHRKKLLRKGSYLSSKALVYIPAHVDPPFLFMLTHHSCAC